MKAEVRFEDKMSIVTGLYLMRQLAVQLCNLDLGVYIMILFHSLLLKNIFFANGKDHAYLNKRLLSLCLCACQSNMDIILEDFKRCLMYLHNLVPLD